jgi:hypothetical protein
MNPSTAEGGVIAEEFQAKNNFDRTETLGTILLGMTLNCARCHTHKYDPIQQEEYYQLLAFFNSTAESPLDGNSYFYKPILEVPKDQSDWSAWQAIEQARDDVLRDSKLEENTNTLAFAQSVAGWKVSDWKISNPVAINAPMPAEGKEWKAIKELPGEVGRERLPETDKARWLTFRVNSPTNQWVWMTFAGASATNSTVFIDENEELVWSGDQTQTVGLNLKQGDQQLRVKMGGLLYSTKVRLHFNSPWHTLAKSKKWSALTPDDYLLLLADPHGPFAHHPQHVAARDVARQMVGARADFATTLVTEELGNPRITRILMRGEYNLPIGDALEPGVLSAMGSLPKGAPKNRLGLAQWLTDRSNPVVSRVLMNQIWQRCFGDGLVRTPEDFGLQGEQPTHPELMDWLAVELQDSNWDMKHMLRLIVTSRTFKQDSAHRAEANDPENRLLARGPAFRLDAEVIRDIGLWSSNLLDPHMGGEGVKPYQPAGLWSALMHPASNTKKYVADEGARLYRRSLYVYWKRTSPHPMMTLFNAPDRESSCVQRSSNSTPLQSLSLFNETQRIEMGRALAARLLTESSTDEHRLDSLFGLLACRNPNAAERAACTTLLETMRERYANAETEAQALLAIGDAPNPADHPPAELAAWTQVAITVLASDIGLLLY